MFEKGEPPIIIGEVMFKGYHRISDWTSSSPVSNHTVVAQATVLVRSSTSEERLIMNRKQCDRRMK